MSWITSALQVEREEGRMPMASLVFVTIEGLVLMDALDNDALIASALEGIALR